MPESYALTVSFKPHLKYQERMKLVELFRKYIRDELKFVVSYNLMVTVEYHKYKPPHPFVGKPNPMAPHVHAYLEIPTDEGLDQKIINKLFTFFSKKYGRTQFDQLHTREDIERWIEYIKKDVEGNNSLYPSIKHYREIFHDLDTYLKKNPLPSFSDDY